MTEKVLLAVLAPAAGCAALLLYLLLAETWLSRLPRRRQALLRPWCWLAPALLLLGGFLLYPLAQTLLDSFRGADGAGWVGLENYAFAFTDPSMRSAIQNNLLWLGFFASVSVGVGLMMAVLTDRVRYGGAVKTLLFMPMAISYVAVGVIWRFMYAYRPPGAPQTGTLNAVVTGVLGLPPVLWLVEQPVNTLALIAAGVWTVAGFCTVILSAGLRGLPQELLEAARVDGAGEWQVFGRVTLPLLAPTVAVVVTTMVVSALKVFDIVYVMTNGNFDTDVIANQIYKQLFVARHLGRASAVAVLLLLALAPIMVMNVRRFRAQEAIR